MIPAFATRPSLLTSRAGPDEIPPIPTTDEPKNNVSNSSDSEPRAPARMRDAGARPGSRIQYQEDEP